MQKTITCIEISSSKISALMASVSANKISILSVASAQSFGVTKGIVTNITLVSNTINKLILELEANTGFIVNDVFVGVSGNAVSLFNVQENMEINNKVTQEHINALLYKVNSNITNDDYLLEERILSYQLDGTFNTQAIDSRCLLLSVNVCLFLSSKNIIKNFYACFEKQINVAKIYSLNYLSSLPFLSPSNSQYNCIVDIGEQFTNISIFFDNQLIFCKTMNIGSQRISNDISIVLNIPFDSADYLKKVFGNAYADSALSNKFIYLRSISENIKIKLYQRELAEIIQARCEEICKMIELEIYRSGFFDKISEAIILTGGTTKLAGFEQLAKSVFSKKVEVKVNDSVFYWVNKNNQAILVDAKKATDAQNCAIIGLLLYSLDIKLDGYDLKHKPKNIKNFFYKIKKIAYDYF